MTVLPTPSEVFSLDLLTPQEVGIQVSYESGGKLVNGIDTGPNFMTTKIEEAAERLLALVPTAMLDGMRFKRAVAYWALAETYLALARRTGRFIGQVSDRTGQTTISAASAAANRQSAEEMYDKAQELYPEVAFPELGESAGGCWNWKRQ